MPRPARFTIRATSALTGINPNTLRAWERRHGLVQPERTPKGYRLYTADDLRRLHLIQTALHQGISIGRMSEHLERLATGEAPRPPAASAQTHALPRPPPDVAAGLTGFSEQIEEAVLRFDHARLEHVFGRAVGLYTLRDAFNHALAPALIRIGERVALDGTMIAEESFLTAFARERLLAALAGLKPLHQHPRLVCVCVPGERHELGLMRFALEAGLEGVSTLYLCPGVTEDGLLEAASDAGVRAVALWATATLPLDIVARVQEQLAALPRRPALLVGGPAAETHAAWLEERGIRVLALDASEAGREGVEVVLRS